MNYLIVYNGEAFYTNWFDKENNYVKGMVVVNLLSHQYTINGGDWFEVQEDSL